jgi:hypothetical protein
MGHKTRLSFCSLLKFFLTAQKLSSPTTCQVLAFTEEIQPLEVHDITVLGYGAA